MMKTSIFEVLVIVAFVIVMIINFGLKTAGEASSSEQSAPESSLSAGKSEDSGAAQQSEHISESTESALAQSESSVPTESFSTSKNVAGGTQKPSETQQTGQSTTGNAQELQEQPQPSQSAPQTYSVTGPDGIVYTGPVPMYIICKCGEQLASGAGWQTHFENFGKIHCSCGVSLSNPGEWETHAGIYDGSSFAYTGKTREQAATDGHLMTNIATWERDYNLHSGWRTTGF